MTRLSNEKLSRKQRQRLWQKSLVLEAAEVLFADKGYHDTTMQEIAHEAEFSTGFLYNAFGNKEEIYKQLINSRCEQYYREAESRMEGKKKAMDKLREVIKYKLEFFARHRSFFRIFAKFASTPDAGPPPVVPGDCLVAYRKYQQKLADVFSEGIKEGDFVNLDPSLAALALEGVTNAIIGRWIYTGESQMESVQPETIERIVFDGFRFRGQKHETTRTEHINQKLGG